MPSWADVCGAQLPHVLRRPLPRLGGLLRRRLASSPGRHQVPAQQPTSGQQLRAPHARVQQGQSPGSESSGTTRLQSLRSGYRGNARVCVCEQGTTVENICFELRYLPDSRKLATDHSLLLLCDLSHANPDAVDVAIVSPRLPSAGRRRRHPASLLLCSVRSLSTRRICRTTAWSSGRPPPSWPRCPSATTAPSCWRSSRSKWRRRWRLRPWVSRRGRPLGRGRPPCCGCPSARR